MKLSAPTVRKTLNKMISQAGKKMKSLRRKKNKRALNRMATELYNIRDTLENAVGVFEEMSSDAEHAVDDIEDSEMDDDE